jgi:hypothetical protein
MTQAGHWVWWGRLWIFQFELVTTTAATSIAATTVAATCVVTTTIAATCVVATTTAYNSTTAATTKDSSAAAQEDNFASREDIIIKEDNFITI